VELDALKLNLSIYAHILPVPNLD